MLPKAAETPFLAAAVLRNPEAMRTFYHAQGYCVVEEALSEAECDELNRTVEPFLVRQPEDEKYKPLMNPDRENPIFAAAVRHTNLVRISELLLQWKVEALQTMYYWKPQLLEARKGAAALIHGRLIHGTADNHSPLFLRAYLVVYIRQGAPFVAGRYGKRMRIDVYTSPS